MNKEDVLHKDCKICHLEVRYVDDFIKLEEYIRGKFSNVSYFHRKCYRDMVNPLSKIHEMTKKVESAMTGIIQ